MPSLSQTYRPQRFADVTGQAHISETLRKEIATNQLGHAYLFSGPRGVGKTTSARIFAKALNCSNPQEGEPCTTCPSCTAFQSGGNVDVIELDAATHTGVDTVRESIVEHARFAPMMSKRKVYILDEAHMLSTASWNALLKTLEEPPVHAFFILATTEVHKVPATIVSRCQRFEFRRIADVPLSERLQEISAKEGLIVDADVVRLIVSRSEGCLRDAETLLGQLSALGEKHLTKELAELVIPASRLPLAAELVKTWAKKDHTAALRLVQTFFDQGVPLLPLVDDILIIIKKLFLASADPGLRTLWQEGMEEERCLVPLAGVFTPLELNDLALLLMERRRDMKGGVDPVFAFQLISTVAACREDHQTSVSMPLIPTSGVSTPTPVVTSSPAPSSPLSPAPVASTPLATVAAPVVLTTHEEAVVEAVSPEEPADITLPQVEMRPEVATIPVTVTVTPPSVSELGAVIDINLVRAKWNTIIRTVEEKNHSLPFILKISRPEMVQEKTIFIRFQYSFHRDKVISDLKNRRLLEEAIFEVLQIPGLKIDGLIGEEVQEGEQRSQDMVANVLKAFGGNMVE